MHLDGFLFVDVETTGLDPAHDAITSIAWMWCDSQLVPKEVFCVRVDARQEALDGMSEHVREMQRFVDASRRWETDPISPATIRAALDATVEGKSYALAGHNVAFDAAFLSAPDVGFAAPYKQLCTLQLTWPEYFAHRLSSQTLSSCFEHFYGFRYRSAHHPDADVLASWRVACSVLRRGEAELEAPIAQEWR